MHRQRRGIRTAALGVAAVVAFTACAGGGDTAAPAESPAAQTQTPAAAAPDASSPAADLRAALTALLQEHVYLAGIAVVMGVQAGGNLEDPTFQAAAAALDQNSQDLAAAIGSVYGQEAADAFLPLWRKHIEFFVNYTLAKATGDEAAAQQAVADLDQYRADFGAFLASANPNLPAEAVAEELVPHVQTVLATIDAVIAGDGTAFAELKEAAAHMPHTAEVLAGAIVAQFPDRFAG